jgi:two-component system, chemotaxis family, chemotaxis protein CheY
LRRALTERFALKRFLIVEDHDFTRKALRVILEKTFHCEVFEAYDGAEGLGQCAKAKPQIVFLDIQMPNMNGIEFLKRLRQKPRFKDVKVLVLSAIGEKSVVGDALSLGISGYLLKPFDRDVIIEKVLELVGDDKSVFKPKKTPTKSSKQNREYLLAERLLVLNTDYKLNQIYSEAFEFLLETTTTRDPKDALQQFHSEGHDVVYILDTIPMVDAYDLINRVRDRDRDKRGDTKIVFVGDCESESELKRYDGCQRKTQNPSRVVADLLDVLDKGDRYFDFAKTVVRRLRPDIVEAVRESAPENEYFDVTKPSPAALYSFENDFRGRVAMSVEGSDVLFSIHIFGTRHDLHDILAAFGDEKTLDEEKSRHKLVSFIDAVAERFLPAFYGRGVPLERVGGDAKISRERMNEIDFDYAVLFQGQKLGNFYFAVHTERAT